jgi:hypothetical protein
MRIKTTRLILATLALLVAFAAAPFASAGQIYITGSGTWDAGTPTTTYSADGATWQFSFFLPGPNLASNPTTQDYTFAYYLNGSLVSTTLPGGILFYPVSEGGGFDLFTDGQTGVNIVSLYFPEDVGSSLNVVDGVYATAIGLNDGELPENGSGTVTIVTTPEPPSILLLGTALLMGSGLIYWRRNESHATPPR